MKFIVRIFFVVFSVLVFFSNSHLLAQSRKIKKAEAKAEKVKAKQKKDFEIAKKKDVKRRYEMQSPETKKRMKNTGKSSKRLNSANHEPFYKKIFHRKRKNL